MEAIVGPSCYADNDPVNKVDPLGLRAKDASVVLVDDFRYSTGSYSAPGNNVFSAALGWVMDQATGYEPIDHADSIQSWSRQATMDPRLVWGIIAVESQLRQSAPKPGGQLWDVTSLARGLLTGKEASLGIGNMQEDVFVQTLLAHPSIIGRGSISAGDAAGRWAELIHDDGLAIATTTYHLRDLDTKLLHEVAQRRMSIVTEGSVVPEINSSGSFRTVYVRRTWVLAAAYNAGEDRIRQALDGQGFGAAADDVNDVQREMDNAGGHYCSTGTLYRC